MNQRLEPDQRTLRRQLWHPVIRSITKCHNSHKHIQNSLTRLEPHMYQLERFHQSYCEDYQACDVVVREHKLSNLFRIFYTSYIIPIFVVHYVKIDIKNKEAQKRCSVTYSIMCIQKTRGLESDQSAVSRNMKTKTIIS